MTEKTALTCFDDFLNAIAAETEPKERLFFAAGIIELLRRTKNQQTVLAMAQLLAELPEVNWAAIPFSVTQAVLGSTYHDVIRAEGIHEQDVPAVLRSALTCFLDFVQGGAELSPDVFKAIVISVAADMAKPKQKATHKIAPEIFNERLVARSFTPEKITEQTLSSFGASLVTFRGELPGSKLGPDIRGLAFDTGVTPSPILLETGEIVKVPPNALNVANATTPEDFKNIPTSLLVSVSLASVHLYMAGVLTKEQETFLNSGGLGKPVQAIHTVVVSVEDLQPLEHVFDKGRDSLSMGVTGPSGATVRFPVPDTDMAVVIDARHSANGPYSVSRLVRTNADGDDTIIMRHDTPRLFTAKGVYIFPTKDSGLVSLTAIF